MPKEREDLGVETGYQTVRTEMTSMEEGEIHFTLLGTKSLLRSKVRRHQCSPDSRRP